MSAAYSNSNDTFRYLCNHRRAYKLFTNSISPKCKVKLLKCSFAFATFRTITKEKQSSPKQKKYRVQNK